MKERIDIMIDPEVKAWLDENNPTAARSAKINAILKDYMNNDEFNVPSSLPSKYIIDDVMKSEAYKKGYDDAYMNFNVDCIIEQTNPSSEMFAVAKKIVVRELDKSRMNCLSSRTSMTKSNIIFKDIINFDNAWDYIYVAHYDKMPNDRCCYAMGYINGYNTRKAEWEEEALEKQFNEAVMCLIIQNRKNEQCEARVKDMQSRTASADSRNVDYKNIRGRC
jgi:hypothetical protein